MSTNALSIIPIKTDNCPTMYNQAVKKKMTASWGNHKFGDIILFDFNRNKVADHIGVVVAKSGSVVRTVEGNTSAGSNTNGGQVQLRSRTKTTTKCFVRPKYNKKVTPAMVVYTALGQVGIKESPANSNKVKYNEWFYGRNTSAYWCATYVCWLFAHVETIPKAVKPKDKYTGTMPTSAVRYGCTNGAKVKNLQNFLNWYLKGLKIKLTTDGECGPKTMRAIMVYQNTEGLAVDADFGTNSIARAKTYAPAKKPATTTKPVTTTKPAAPAKPSTPSKPAPTILAPTAKTRKIEVDLTNQITTIYGKYSDGTWKPFMSEFVSTARKGKTTPVGNWKIQGSKNLKAKYRTAKLSGGKSYAEYLVRFKGAKCMHMVPYSKRNTSGKVSKGEFNKLGTPRSAGCVRMPAKMARYIYNNCPLGTPVKVFKGKSGEYPMGKPKKYTATTSKDPTY